VDAVDYEGKTCPCGDGYACVEGKCRHLGDAGTQDGDAGTPDGDAESDGEAHCTPPNVPPVARLTAGQRHTCAIRGGELWCWGINDRGQLGLGDLESRSFPVRVGTESDWLTVSAASGHTCGIRSTNNVGGLYCWGDNEQGQLGTGAGEEMIPTPTLVSNNIQFATVATGESHTCGLQGNGTLWCWGRQAGGAVGLGNLGEPMTSPARVSQVDSFVDLSAGAGHNCVVRDDATLWCWGHFECFQLGTPNHQLVPHQVDAQCWRDVAAGATHTCGILDDDTLRCFGSNGRGQLGNGVVGGGEPGYEGCLGYVEPQVVQGGHSWRAVTGGWLHTCGITTEGALYCWGYNEQNQIADVEEDGIPTPMRVGTESNWVEVAAGFFHTCARNTDDEVYCQGLNEDGQQGTGTYNRTLVLVEF